MPTAKGLNYSVVFIPIGEGETLTLAPRETAGVSDRVVAPAASRKLVRQGALSVVRGRPDVNIPKKK